MTERVRYQVHVLDKAHGTIVQRFDFTSSQRRTAQAKLREMVKLHGTDKALWWDTLDNPLSAMFSIPARRK